MKGQKVKIKSVNLNNKLGKEINLSDKIFGIIPREDIVSRVIRWQLAKRRLGNHSVQTRSQVKMTTAKMYKQKGTGKWTSQSAMDFGVSIPTIDSSVSMRIISSFKNLRIKGENIFGSKEIDDKSIKVDDVEKSLIFSFVISFAQGLSQLKVASDEKSYNLNFEEICKIWRGGCIIRAKLLENFMKAFNRNNELSNLLFDDEISSIVKGSVDSARKVSVYCINNQIPAFSLLASISYFDSIKSSKLPMNLIQAQRDCFGEHTFERIDKPGTFHYKDWQN